jgi:hypothetical protein
MVQQPGMQEFSGGALAAVGFNLAGTDPATLQLSHLGKPTPIEIDGLVGGRLASTSTIRFYAASAGDRWNLNEVYWLTTVAGGARMDVRSVAPQSAAARSTVVERGVWQADQAYSSNLPGIDGDHWFSRQLSFDPNLAPPAVTLTINHVLPPAAGSATYTFTLSSAIPATFTLQTHLGSDVKTLTWAAQPPNGLPRDNAVATGARCRGKSKSIRHDQGDFPEPALWFDGCQPTTELCAGWGKFSGVAGFCYQWGCPQRRSGHVFMTSATQSAYDHQRGHWWFEDGPATHDCLLAGPGSLFHPRSWPRVAFRQHRRTGDYIAPQEFMAALGPLLAQRRSQGYTVCRGCQAIYDA